MRMLGVPRVLGPLLWWRGQPVVCGACRRVVKDAPTRNAHSAPHNSTASASSDEPDAETHFGFETVSHRAKTAKVHGVFEQVANKYDVMNDVMSAGIHRLWKDSFVRMLAPRPGNKILDVAGGTGDIAFRLLNYMDYVGKKRSFPSESRADTNELGLQMDTEPVQPAPPRADVTVFDLSQSMLDVGQRRAQHNGFEQRTAWVCGNAEELPFADDTFDAYTIAFGIRNVTHMDRALDEAYRVLKRGGRLMILEFSQVQNPVLEWLYDKYSLQVIPVLGQLIASDWKSYQYLVESIRMFPNQQDFATFIQETGFVGVTFRNLSQGICAIHSGFKL